MMSALNKTLRPGKGVLLFSFNNEKMRYDLLARECARRVVLHLGLPVVVVTDTEIEGLECIIVDTPVSNPRYYPDSKESLSFLNGGRHNAYDLSPFEETLVIDTDYLLQTSNLKHFVAQRGLRLSKLSVNIDGSELASEMRTLGDVGLPTYFGTVILFDRSPTSRLFFHYWKQAIKDWAFHTEYFQFTGGKLIRNDFAVTIALHRVFRHYGIPPETSMGLDIVLVPVYWQVSDVCHDTHIAIYLTEGDTPTNISGLDLHILNKKSLIEVLARE